MRYVDGILFPIVNHQSLLKIVLSEELQSEELQSEELQSTDLDNILSTAF